MQGRISRALAVRDRKLAALDRDETAALKRGLLAGPKRKG
jgi:hypothetical protein